MNIKGDGGMYQYKYLPRDKFDFERVRKLKGLSRSELLSLLPGLLQWIQDMNWPIAVEVVEILLAFPNELVPYIKEVLSSDDDIWKYWCLEGLLKRFPKETKQLFHSDLIRLVERPTEGEKLEELDETATEILQML